MLVNFLIETKVCYDYDETLGIPHTIITYYGEVSCVV